MLKKKEQISNQAKQSKQAKVSRGGATHEYDRFNLDGLSIGKATKTATKKK